MCTSPNTTAATKEKKTCHVRVTMWRRSLLKPALFFGGLAVAKTTSTALVQLPNEMSSHGNPIENPARSQEFAREALKRLAVQQFACCMLHFNFGTIALPASLHSCHLFCLSTRGQLQVSVASGTSGTSPIYTLSTRNIISQCAHNKTNCDPVEPTAPSESESEKKEGGHRTGAAATTGEGTPAALITGKQRSQSSGCSASLPTRSL
jgi:hypothetical protein